MATFRISGVWENTNNVITHYAIHTVGETSISRAAKTTKADAIRLVETRGNIVTTLVWNYNRAGWIVGENVEVVNGNDGKYLRSNPNDKKTDNLGHLIDYDWINP
jgi:hypothetical protein